MKSYFDGDHPYPHCGWPLWGYFNDYNPVWAITDLMMGGVIKG